MDMEIVFPGGAQVDAVLPGGMVITTGGDIIVRRAVDVLGGSLGVERLPREASPDVGDQVTDLRCGEAALGERVRSVFDPPGVFWRAGRPGGGGAGASAGRAAAEPVADGGRP